jgi:hypothetical protein
MQEECRAEKSSYIFSFLVSSSVAFGGRLPSYSFYSSFYFTCSSLFSIPAPSSWRFLFHFAVYIESLTVSSFLNFSSSECFFHSAVCFYPLPTTVTAATFSLPLQLLRPIIIIILIIVTAQMNLFGSYFELFSQGAWL